MSDAFIYLSRVRIDPQSITYISTGYVIDQIARRSALRRGSTQLGDHFVLGYVLRQRKPRADARTKAGEKLSLP